MFQWRKIRSQELHWNFDLTWLIIFFALWCFVGYIPVVEGRPVRMRPLPCCGLGMGWFLYVFLNINHLAISYMNSYWPLRNWCFHCLLQVYNWVLLCCHSMVCWSFCADLCPSTWLQGETRIYCLHYCCKSFLAMYALLLCFLQLYYEFPCILMDFRCKIFINHVRIWGQYQVYLTVLHIRTANAASNSCH